MAECGTPYLDCTNKNEGLESVFKRLISVDAEGNLSLNICGCECEGGGGGAGLISVTYAELVALIGSSGLTAGQYYLLTDFATVHYFTDDGSTLADINTGATEALVLLATSVNTIDSRVYSPTYPQDIIHYDWDADKYLPDISFSDDGNNIIAGWKGVITYRHDTKQDNYTWYDFRNVKYRRWKTNPDAWAIGTTYTKGQFVVSVNKIYISLQDANTGKTPASESKWWGLVISYNRYLSWSSTSCNGINADANDYIDSYTFPSYDEYYLMNHVESQTWDGNTAAYSYYTRLNNIVFGYYCYDMKIGVNCSQITFGDMCYDISIEPTSAQIIFGDNCFDIELKKDNWNNTIGDSCYWCSLNIGVVSSYICTSCKHIELGIDNRAIIIGNGSYEIYFKPNCEYIEIGGAGRKNSFEHNVVSLNLCGATHIYNAYNCTIQKREDTAARLSYINNSDVLTIVNATA